MKKQMDESQQNAMTKLKDVYDTLMSKYDLHLTLTLNHIGWQIREGNNKVLLETFQLDDEKIIRTLRSFGFRVRNVMDPDNFVRKIEVSWEKLIENGQINYNILENQLITFEENGSVMKLISLGLINPILVETNPTIPRVSKHFIG